jgi:hypothetical protein
VKRSPLRSLPLAVGLTLAAVVAGGGVASCAKRDAGTSSGGASEEAGTPVDVDVMAFLSEARALHHEANVREAADDAAGAVAALERLTRARRPHDGARVPEVEEVLADTYARLAELRLRAGDLDAASRDVAEGLAHAPDATYFRGHLFEVHGIVEEARAAALADAGKKDEAKGARERAIGLLHEAVQIQDRVIQSAVGADGGGPR